MEENCKHIPGNIFKKKLYCKHCWKQITYKHKYTLVISFFIITLGSVIICDFLFYDLIINNITKVLYASISTLISILCSFLFVIKSRFKEIS